MMKQKYEYKMRRGVSLLLLIVFLLPMFSAYGETAAPTASAETEEPSEDISDIWNSTFWLTGRYGSPGAKERRVWKFPFSDAMFADAAQYDHTLAQASLGMALSAFRSKEAASDAQDAAVREYLEQADFEHFVSADYDQTPTADTISTVLASKRIGDFTLIAAAICGGGYGDEWMSNFTIGDETRHVGFDAAARKVEERIRDYLSAQGITGEVRLWISGYSRAAAVTNLAAADMSDSGLFSAVYGYCFATPRVTKAPGNYPNIFNILGKFDPVPMVPAAAWGYQRNGVEMYTPAQETDSDYNVRMAAADRVCRLLTGTPFFNNVPMNNTLHTILDYVMNMIPSSKVYLEHVQAKIIEAWRDRSIQNLSGVASKLLGDKELLDDRQREELDELLDFLSVVTYTTVTGSAQWNSGTGMLDNLAHEHSPDVYVCWMFSTANPTELFNGGQSFMRLSWSGTGTAYVLDGDLRFLFQTDNDGSVSYVCDQSGIESLAPPLSERPTIAYEHKGTQHILSLPRDNDYAVVLAADGTDDLMYYGALYQVDQIKADVTKIFYAKMEKDELYTIMSLEAGELGQDGPLIGNSDFDLNVFDGDIKYTPSLFTQLDNVNVFHLTLTQMLWLVGGVALLLLIILVLTIILLVRRHRRKLRRRSAAAIAAGEAECPDTGESPKGLEAADKAENADAGDGAAPDAKA